MTCAGGLTFPEASTAVTFSAVSSGIGVVGVKVNLPSAPAVVVPMTLPELSVIFTVLPASAVPVIKRPLVE